MQIFVGCNVLLVIFHGFATVDIGACHDFIIPAVKREVGGSTNCHIAAQLHVCPDKFGCKNGIAHQNAHGGRSFMLHGARGKHLQHATVHTCAALHRNNTCGIALAGGKRGSLDPCDAVIQLHVIGINTCGIGTRCCQLQGAVPNIHVGVRGSDTADAKSAFLVRGADIDLQLAILNADILHGADAARSILGGAAGDLKIAPRHGDRAAKHHRIGGSAAYLDLAADIFKDARACGSQNTVHIALYVKHRIFYRKASAALTNGDRNDHIIIHGGAMYLHIAVFNGDITGFGIHSDIVSAIGDVSVLQRDVTGHGADQTRLATDRRVLHGHVAHRAETDPVRGDLTILDHNVLRACYNVSV